MVGEGRQGRRILAQGEPISLNSLSFVCLCTSFEYHRSFAILHSALDPERRENSRRENVKVCEKVQPECFTFFHRLPTRYSEGRFRFYCVDPSAECSLSVSSSNLCTAWLPPHLKLRLDSHLTSSLQLQFPLSLCSDSTLCFRVNFTKVSCSLLLLSRV